MPSRREPFGLVALEAMACGLPVVGSNEGGLPEFINSSVGTLVSSNDEDAFCGAILEELAHSREAPGGGRLSPGMPARTSHRSSLWQSWRMSMLPCFPNTRRRSETV